MGLGPEPQCRKMQRQPNYTTQSLECELASGAKWTT